MASTTPGSTAAGPAASGSAATGPAASGSVYYGAYRRFETVDKTAGAALAGPDNAVGDVGTVEMGLDERKHEQAWLVNRFGARIGFLDARESHTLAVLAAKGWRLRYVLSFTAYSEQPDPGLYWGQAAVMAYDPRHEASFERFIELFAKRAAEGNRPNPELSEASVAAVVGNPESWKPSSPVRIPVRNGTGEGGASAVLKDHRSLHDKMLDAARARNVGCMAAGWLFILALAAAVVYAVHAAGVF